MLDFSLSKSQKMMKDSFAQLVKDLVAPQAHEMDEKGTIPAGTVQKAWELGASLSLVPESYGGFGMDAVAVETAIILEELAYGDMAFAIQALLPSLFIHSLVLMGTPEQQQKFLPLYCRDAYRPCSLALSEPRFNFDPRTLQTRAERKNGSYRITGKKCLVPMAFQAEHILVAAESEGTNRLFIVERDNPGLVVGEREENMGIRALPTYPIELKDCEIPAGDRLGDDTDQPYEMLLQRTRIALSAIGTGVSRAAFEFVREYAKTRIQFGEPIAHRQAVAFLIAEMAYEVDAMRLLTWKAASVLDSGKSAARESYLAKLNAGEMTMKLVDYGVQIMGGHGYIRDYPVERYYRNGRGISILEGIATV